MSRQESLGDPAAQDTRGVTLTEIWGFLLGPQRLRTVQRHTWGASRVFPHSPPRPVRGVTTSRSLTWVPAVPPERWPGLPEGHHVREVTVLTTTSNVTNNSNDHGW